MFLEFDILMTSQISVMQVIYGLSSQFQVSVHHLHVGAWI